MTAWNPGDLRLLGTAVELEIAARRADGSLRRWLPIWVVRAGDRVYVRTWYRRDTGWFGQVLASGRAGIRVPGLRADVTVHDVGAGENRAAVDAAYRTKYGGSAVGQMVSDAAAATTLRLDPEPEH